MTTYRHPYFYPLVFLTFAPVDAQAVIAIDNFSTGLGSNSGATSATLGPSLVDVNGANFNRTITANFDPTFVRNNGPRVDIVMSTNTVTEQITAGFPPFSESGASTIMGSYITTSIDLNITYDYGPKSLTFLYAAATPSDFVDLSSNPIVESDIHSTGSASFSATVTNPAPNSLTPTFLYQMIFGDGTNSATVNGIQMPGFVQFDATAISGMISLAHIVNMNLTVSSNSMEVTNFGVPRGNEEKLDMITLHGTET